ncbi:MAG: hypothetical protein HYX75_18835 [Acidobacteria bacterium]|nr:hypothetical protein [Acidobacteriota bacterium]
MDQRPTRETLKELHEGEDPVIEAYKKHIDRSLLRENLRRTVAERMSNLMALQRLAVEVRSAGRQVRKRL